jgi:CheY-like chemotaxis protein
MKVSMCTRRNIEEAVSALNTEHFDVVLTEVKMKHEEDGFGVLNAANASINPPLVIFLTGLARVSSTVKAIKAGAVEYLQKPVGAEEVIASVNAALARRQQGQFARMEVGKPIAVEENVTYELKTVRGANPVSTITNQADEYAVAFLNSEGGTVLWGVQDSDHIVIGVHLEAIQRDRLRRDVYSKLASVRPAVVASAFRLRFHPTVDAENAAISNVFVVELNAPAGETDRLYWTGGNETFIRVDGVKKKLSGPEIQDWIERRLGIARHKARTVPTRRKSRRHRR